MVTHVAIAQALGKPIVLEEFGLDRDMGNYNPDSGTHYRDTYYQKVFALMMESMKKGEASAGYNFWAWNGSARTTRSNHWWQEGDDFMGDPPQE
jgi:mannan endo-1,4-beta-mannosidase